MAAFRVSWPLVERWMEGWKFSHGSADKSHPDCFFSWVSPPEVIPDGREEKSFPGEGGLVVQQALAENA